MPAGTKGTENLTRGKTSAGVIRDTTALVRNTKGAPQAQSVVPDPSPFLSQPGLTKAKAQQQKSVLPPIKVTNTLVNKAVGGGASVIVKKRSAAKGSRRDGKIETLAVDATDTKIQPGHNSSPTDAS